MCKQVNIVIGLDCLSTHIWKYRVIIIGVNICSCHCYFMWLKNNNKFINIYVDASSPSTDAWHAAFSIKLKILSVCQLVLTNITDKRWLDNYILHSKQNVCKANLEPLRHFWNRSYKSDFSSTQYSLLLVFLYVLLLQHFCFCHYPY